MTMQPIPTYAEALEQLDALRAQVATLAKLLKEREWQSDEISDGYCHSCGTNISCGPGPGYDFLDESLPKLHKPDCELAAALRAAGLDAEVADG